MNNLEIIIICLSIIFYIIPTTISILNLLFFNSNDYNKYEKFENMVSVLIPARNEEKNIEKCVDSVVNQGEIVSEIIIYDDHSTDKTKDIIKFLTKKYESLVKQAKTKNLPKGWLGKNYACHNLSTEAKSQNILFIDADTTLKDNAVSKIVSISLKNKITMISAWPKIKMESRTEKILMPVLNLIVFTLFPYIISTKFMTSSLGLAHGACIFFNKKKYIKYGGHKLVKNNFFEDTSLAKKWRDFGENSQIINGEKIIEVRMYESLKEIIDGFTKNFYPALGNLFRFTIFQTYFALSYIIFPILVFIYSYQDKIDVLFLSVIILSILPRIIINIKFKYQILSLILNPFSILIMLFIGYKSFYQSVIKKNITWKKRIYNFD